MAKRTARQIVVMGGGSWPMEPRNPRLDRYLFSLTSKSRPRICFVATASGDSRNFVARFYRAMAKHGMSPREDCSERPLSVDITSPGREGP